MFLSRNKLFENLSDRYDILLDNRLKFLVVMIQIMGPLWTRLCWQKVRKNRFPRLVFAEKKPLGKY